MDVNETLPLTRQASCYGKLKNIPQTWKLSEICFTKRERERETIFPHYVNIKKKTAFFFPTAIQLLFYKRILLL